MLAVINYRTQRPEQQANQLLHPTACGSTRSSLRFPRRVRYCVDRQGFSCGLRGKICIKRLLAFQHAISQMQQFPHGGSDNEHLAFALS